MKLKEYLQEGALSILFIIFCLPVTIGLLLIALYYRITLGWNILADYKHV